MATSPLEEIILKLHDVDAVKLGEYKLKSGMMTPIYIDLRVLVAYPALMNQVMARAVLPSPATQRGARLQNHAKIKLNRLATGRHNDVKTCL